jgi:hypothetical protein
MTLRAQCGRAVLTALLLLVARAGAAATITVTSIFLQPGQCTLGQAILTANTTLSGDHTSTQSS